MVTTLHVIAHLHSDFPTKFGLPRQSGLVGELTAAIVFTPEYRRPDALRGIEQFSHLWILWGFQGVKRDHWQATVRPPRLGGNERLGVFATRSPFRPSNIGLSCVALDSVIDTPDCGHILRVSGADMMDGTEIYDIKPYLPYADCVPAARGGFAEEHAGDALRVVFPDELSRLLPPDKLPALLGALARDPRPAYQSDPARVYGFPYAGFDIRFRVENGVLTVCEILPEKNT